MASSDEEEDLENPTFIKLIYNGIEKKLKAPDNLEGLKKLFFENFQEDQEKNFEYFYEDEDEKNENKKKKVITKDFCYSDFQEDMKIYIEEIKPKIEESVIIANPNNSSIMSSTFVSDIQKLQKQIQDLEESNKLIQKSNIKLSIEKQKLKKEIEEKDLIIEKNENEENESKLKLQNEYNSKMEEFENEFKKENDISKIKEEKEKVIKELIQKIEDFKKELDEKKNIDIQTSKELSVLVNEKDKINKKNEELEEKINQMKEEPEIETDEPEYVEENCNNNTKSLILSINEDGQKELMLALKKKNEKDKIKNEKKKEMMKIINEKLKKQKKEKKLNNDIQDIIKQENQNCSKILETSKLNKKEVKKEDLQEINGMKEENEKLKNGIKDKREKLEKKKNEYENELNQENIKKKLKEKYENEIKNKINELKNSLNEKLEQSITNLNAFKSELKIKNEEEEWKKKEKEKEEEERKKREKEEEERKKKEKEEEERKKREKEKEEEAKEKEKEKREKEEEERKQKEKEEKINDEDDNFSIFKEIKENIKKNAEEINGDDLMDKNLNIGQIEKENQSKNLSSSQSIYKRMNTGEKLANNKSTIFDVRNSFNKKLAFENLYYSYECINNINLTGYIYEKSETAKIDITLKNDGTLDWPENKTKLIFEKKSQVKGKEITLKPQEIGSEERYEIIINDLAKLKEGEYKSCVRININGQNIGEKLDLKIKIKKKEDPNEEMNQHMGEIESFRAEFALEETEYSNERLFKVLKENDYDFEQSFASLFN